MDFRAFDGLFKQLELDSKSFFKSMESNSNWNGGQGISYKETVQTLKKSGSDRPERTANYLFRIANKNKETGELTVNELKGQEAKEKGQQVFKWLDKDVQEYLTNASSMDINKPLSFGQLFNEFDRFGSLDPFNITKNIFNQLDRDMNSLITANEIKENVDKIGWENSKQSTQQPQSSSSQQQQQQQQQSFLPSQ